MTRARNQQIDAGTTPYYHCISRCVRRAFLCGEDSFSGQSYEHRKEWVVERLGELGEVFAIDICAYAVMSNHYHLVLRIDEAMATGLDDEAVMERWGRLHSLPSLIERYRRGGLDTEAEKERAREIIAVWRGRLCDISWFMRGLNEHLARRANEEDGCKGRFWEGRFKSQALLDEAAVLTCMSYVDLNPVRAGLAELPEDSDFTSIQQRIRELAARSDADESDSDNRAEMPQPPEGLAGVPLAALSPGKADAHPSAIGFALTDYLELLDWSGRVLREGKRGVLDAEAPPILERLGLNPERFLAHIGGRTPTEGPTMLGRADHIQDAARELGRRFIKGLGEAKRLYRPMMPA